MKSHEKNFIKRLKRQKEDALEFIVDMYLPLVKGVTYKILAPIGNQGIIDECINDVFLSVWNHADKFHGEQADFKKWICAIAKFKAIDYYRKASKSAELVPEHLHTSVEKSVEDEMIRKENETELLQLINLLEPIDRDIFIMKFFLGLGTEAISTQLGLTRASIENRIYRGKKKIHNKAANLGLGGSVI